MTATDATQNPFPLNLHLNLALHLHFNLHLHLNLLLHLHLDLLLLKDVADSFCIKTGISSSSCAMELEATKACAVAADAGPPPPPPCNPGSVKTCDCDPNGFRKT